VHISDLDNMKPYLDDYPIRKEFQDVFPKDIIELPPKREFEL
jgi:hypothetical protein